MLYAGALKYCADNVSESIYVTFYCYFLYCGERGSEDDIPSLSLLPLAPPSTSSVFHYHISLLSPTPPSKSSVYHFTYLQISY
jgi:hypothetical protein